MAITALPTAPNRATSPATFAAAADAFNAALPTFVTEANALQADVNAKQATVSAAAIAAQDAANMAVAASGLANYKGAWSSATTYSQGQAVLYGSKYWISNVNSNLNVTPVEGASWSSVTDNKTYSGITLSGYTEAQYSLAGTDLAVSNGSIQYKTLAANTTFTESLADGQSVTLMLNPSTYTVTWFSVTWIKPDGATWTSPTLKASVYNCFTFFQIAGVLYGKQEGTV